MNETLKEAVKILKNNFSHRYSQNISGKDKQMYREFMIGVYNRFDEIGLIYSSLEGISFNQAIEELELKDYMNKLSEILATPKASKENKDEKI